MASSVGFNFEGTHLHSLGTEFSWISPNLRATKIGCERGSERSHCKIVLLSDQKVHLHLKSCSSSTDFANLNANTAAWSSKQGMDINLTGLTLLFRIPFGNTNKLHTCKPFCLHRRKRAKLCYSLLNIRESKIEEF